MQGVDRTEISEIAGTTRGPGKGECAPGPRM